MINFIFRSFYPSSYRATCFHSPPLKDVNFYNELRLPPFCFREFSSVICRLKFLRISGDAWKLLKNKSLKIRGSKNKPRGTNRQPVRGLPNSCENWHLFSRAPIRNFLSIALEKCKKKIRYCLNYSDTRFLSTENLNYSIS